MYCKSCNSKNIKTRKNYTHGKSSGSNKSFLCRNCNSTEIGIERKNNFRKKK